MTRRLPLVLIIVLGFAALFAIDGNYRDQLSQVNEQKLGEAMELAQQNLELGIDCAPSGAAR